MSEQARTIVITGANRGIGLAMATQFVANGDNVVALCRESSEALAALNIEVITNVELTNQQSLDMVSEKLKGRCIDLLINNAGILKNETLSDLNSQTITEQFLVNALAPLKLTQALLNNLFDGSKVAFITSRMGSISDNGSGGRYGYRMSKAALNIAAVSLAKDLAPNNIAIGIFHPGYVQTDMTGQRGEITTKQSATGLIKLMDKLSLENSGEFFHSNGQALPW
ncbi:SDR family oxidoreductase [Thalassotalea crassostreae]|uniref:SDR family oxidoreductase n=1 Tax=Thalassotalea crassostreae TaxID=1763536 RepID=UPI0008396CE6|nr:SDR family oxidoreductase [Thalassotalea crassostreae]